MSKFIHLPTLRFYRRLIKTMMVTFDGDYQMFHKMRIQARKKILENKDIRDPIEIQDKIFEGQQNRDFLQHNIMQGTYQQNGTPRLKARKSHGVSSHLKDGSLK